MEITNEMDQDINISQPSPTTLNNNTGNPNNENNESSHDYPITEYQSVNNQMINSYPASNSYSFDQMNNKAMSNSRDDKDIYQSNQLFTPARTTSLGNNDYSNSSDEGDQPPPYEILYQSIKKHIPGTTGLRNLGNTCFMNSGLQCIAHTNLLREYLLKGYWKKELNLTSIHGMKGKVVKAFVKVLENLWSESDESYRPSEFKSIISKHTPSFEGYHQHDCQEFIASLLDGLHEDINRVPVKKFEEYPDMNEMKDEEAAKTSWDLHIRRENSIVVDLFYGQYRSINICQTCETKRLNFEPFVYLTLPIPEKQELEIPIQVLLRGKFIETIRISVLKSQSIICMKEKICEKIKEDNLIPEIEVTKDILEIFQVRDYSMNAYLSNTEQVENIQSIEQNYYVLYAYIEPYEFSVNPIKDYLPSPIEEIPTNSNINVPCYQKVENADRYTSDDNGFPFLINLPKLSHFEDKEKMIDRRLLGWIVYREIVKFYQQFTEYKIATLDPSVELDERVYECLKQVKEEEEALNKPISTNMKTTDKNIDTDDDSINNTGNGVTNILNNDDEIDSHQGNASSNNDESLSDVQINNNTEIDPEDDAPMNDDDDTVLENVYQATQVKQSNSFTKDAVTTDMEIENKEDDVENIYPINDGWKVMSKLFDVQLIYTEKINEYFYAYSYNYNYPRIALYNAKDNSSKESEPQEEKPYSYYRNNTENRNAKVKFDPKDFLIIVTWKPAILRFLFGESKFDIFSPKAPKQSVKRPEVKPISLEDCIQEFIKEEILTGENKWFCPKCKEDQEAYKKMDIWKAPEILIVHLKRFIQDRKYYSSRKNTILVNFPIKGLDLTNVIRGPKGDEKYIYNLYAISNHSGSTGGGHYTAYVKNEGKWYDFNDSFVSEVSENSIISSSAYLLFYERVHEPGKEYKLPNLDNVPDVVDEEEIKLQQLQKQNMQMSMGMLGQVENAETGMDDINNSTNDSPPPSYCPESFADFDHADPMFTSDGDGQNSSLMDINTQPSLNNSNSSDLNNSNNNDILYEGEM